MTRAYYNEHDPFAAEWLRMLIACGHIADGDVDTRSIEDVRPNDLAGYCQVHLFAGIGGWSRAFRLAGVPDSTPLWSCSCPCQPFSAAGKGDGFSDERHLWPSAFHLITQREPQRVFGEQVAAKSALAWLDLVCNDLEAAGYTVGTKDLCAASIGAAHIRQRLYWTADSASQRRQHEPSLSGRDGEMVSASGSRLGTWSDSNSRICADSGRQRDESWGDLRDLVCASGKEQVEAWERQRRGDAYCNGRSTGISADAQLHGSSTVIEPGISEDARGMLESQGSCSAGERSNSDEPGSQGWGMQSGERSVERFAREAGKTRGFWGGADWWYGRDGKYRPIESGLFPLAHGVSKRMGRLRGYGNAIVPQVAAEFIKAALTR